MAKKRENMFAGRTSRSMEKPVSNFGYLKLPDDIKMFKPEGGTEVTFDILPYRVSDENHMDNKKYDTDAVVGELHWKRPIRVHRNVGPEDVMIICPTTIGEKCPICEHGSRRKKEGADWKEELSGIFPKNRTIFLINMIDSSDLDLDYDEDEVYIMDQADTNFLNTLDVETKRDIDNEGFPDPYDGLSVKTYFKAKKLGKVKYGEASRIDFEKRDEQYDEEYVDSLPCLDDIMKIMDYDEIYALYFGMEGMDDEPEGAVEDVSDRRARRKKSNSRRESPRGRRGRTEKEETEVIDDEPEEKTSRRGRSRRTEKEPEPEEKTTPKITPEKLDALARRGLNKLAKELEIDPTEFATDELEALREAIAEALDIELPEVNSEPETEPEPEPEEKTSRRSRRSQPKDKEENKCPAGLNYGTDNDQFDACDTCKVWDACADEKAAG